MDSFLKNLKEKLSVDNLVGMMKDSKVGQQLQQEEVKKTLEKFDPRNITTEEITSKISNVAEQSKQVIEDVSNTVSEETSKIVDSAKSGLSVLRKSSHSIKDDSKNETMDDDDGDDIDPVWDI